MSEHNNHDTPGLVDSVKRMASTSVATLQNRLELFSVELTEQKYHLASVLFWAGLTLFLFSMALLLLTITVVFLFPPEYRPSIFAGLTGLYLLGAFLAVGKLRLGIKKGPSPFADTIAELKKDREWLRNL